MLQAPAASAASVASTATAAEDRPRGRQGAAVQQVLEDAVRSGTPGMLASVTSGGPGGNVYTWRGAAGVADLRTGERRGHHDRFRIGSVTKSLTAAVVLTLAAEGRLDLDDTVEQWLPGLIAGHGHDGSAVTIRQLLNHTSGISDYSSNREFFDRYIGRDFLKNRFQRHTPESLVGWAVRAAPDFAPGTGWRYSNTNYIVAGLIIQKVTGRSYENEVERRVLRPLGMRDTSLPRHSVTLPRPSGRGYTKVPFGDPAGAVHDGTALNTSTGWAAGDIISTTGDLQRFVRALMSGRLLPPAQQKELTTTVPTTEEGHRYGLGVGWTTLPCGVGIWGHAGGIHGSRTGVYADGRGGRSLVVNANADWAGSPEAALNAAFCPPEPRSGPSA
ncbi:D-alanyl-D-alanine carboxypeptidase [Streptomyces clavuligerus]|nr:D-alanyl-D-alanine carboxypeptidase [Streptomyces clavuligerus]